jgi:3-dehydroquinate dehydratase-2
MTSVLVINGPNLDLLGTRKPEVYGTTTLADVEELCQEAAGTLGLEVDFRQSNHEGQLIDWIHQAGAAVKAGESSGAVFNPGALTHTSAALHDAIEGLSLPLVECHISNVHQRGEGATTPSSSRSRVASSSASASWATCWPSTVGTRYPAAGGTPATPGIPTRTPTTSPGRRARCGSAGTAGMGPCWTRAFRSMPARW